MLKLVVVLLAFASQRILSSVAADDLLITLPDGAIQGTTYTTPNNKTYYGFQGIPFATPPIGNLRFEAPQPPQPWTELLDATQDRKACVSINYFVNPDGESEDCLYVNVYTPSLKPAEGLPVMFWIYGGGFTQGSSLKWIYGPDYLIEEDVIMVSHNYRVGPFGFLSTADTAIRGNVGLKDQNLALKWTHDNIALFGGDPEKIIIFGESAGGHSTGHHLLSKKSAGLFRGAIVESGSATTIHAIDMDPQSYAFLLGNAIPGANFANDTQKYKEFLLEQTVEVIMTAANSFPEDTHVMPVVEAEGEDAFLSEYPYELLKSGRFNQVPIIIGICAEEGLAFLKDLDTARKLGNLYDTVPTTIIPTNLRSNSSDDDAVIEKIRNVYLTDSNLFAEDLVALARYTTDNRLGRGVAKHAELTSKYVPAYLYQFAYFGRNFTPAFIDGAEKAAHAAELPFIFHITGFYDPDPDPANLVTQNRMIKLWTNFAKYLNPTPEQSELLNNVIWEPVSLTSQPFLNINGTLELMFNIRPKTYPQWNEIYESYGRKPFITY